MTKVQKRLDSVEAEFAAAKLEHEKHENAAHQQLAVQGLVVAALFLSVKGSRKRVMVPKNILEKAKGLALDAVADKDGNLVLSVRPAPTPEVEA